MKSRKGYKIRDEDPTLYVIGDIPSNPMPNPVVATPSCSLVQTVISPLALLSPPHHQQLNPKVKPSLPTTPAHLQQSQLPIVRKIKPPPASTASTIAPLSVKPPIASPSHPTAQTVKLIFGCVGCGRIARVTNSSRAKITHVDHLE